jgi:hypothetical protein
VTGYQVTIAASAKKELKDLPADVVQRVWDKIRGLPENRGRLAVRSSMAIKAFGGFVSGITASCTALTMRSESSTSRALHIAERYMSHERLAHGGAHAAAKFGKLLFAA